VTPPAPAHRRRILVGTDFTGPAEHAVERAARLAATQGATLEIAHVLVPRPTWGPEPPAEPADLLDAARAAVVQPRLAVHTRLLRGGVAKTLARRAAALGADLLVIGARRERTLCDRLRGTTAEQLLDRWPGPLLVVRTAPTADYARPLLGVALGPASDAVLHAAAELAPLGELALLHVYEPPFETKLLAHGLAEHIIARHHHATREEAARALAALLQRSPARPAVSSRLERGEPIGGLLREARQRLADLLVVGRSPAGVATLLLGGATKAVLRDAQTDVLVAARP